MATEKQIAANRRNAQKSTGPKSEAGKATVSQNRMIHGLCGKFQVLEEIESQERFDALLERYVEELQPNGQVQLDLVEDAECAAEAVNGAVLRDLRSAFGRCRPRGLECVAAIGRDLFFGRHRNGAFPLRVCERAVRGEGTN